MPKFLDSPTWYDSEGNLVEGYSQGVNGQVLKSKGDGATEWKNENSLSVYYADKAGEAEKAGNADTLDNKHASDFLQNANDVFPTGTVLLSINSTAPFSTGWQQVYPSFISSPYTAWCKSESSKTINYFTETDRLTWAKSSEVINIGEISVNTTCTVRSSETGENVYVKISPSILGTTVNSQTSCALFGTNTAQTVNINNITSTSTNITATLFTDTDNIYVYNTQTGSRRIELAHEWQEYEWESITITGKGLDFSELFSIQKYGSIWCIILTTSVLSGKIYLAHLTGVYETETIEKDIIIHTTN